MILEGLILLHQITSVELQIAICFAACVYKDFCTGQSFWLIWPMINSANAISSSSLAVLASLFAVYNYSYCMVDISEFNY